MVNSQNFNNLNISNIFNIVCLLSFVFQWSILSFILNLITLWSFRLPLFVLFILDAISIFIIQDKSIKRPSFILSKIWDILDYFNASRFFNAQNTMSFVSSVQNFFNSLTRKIQNTSNKINSFFNNIRSRRVKHDKYKRERKVNEFSDEIGKKVIVEYTSNGKLDKKTFKYKDEAITYIRLLNSNNYKDFTKYNINPKLASTYIIINKNRDLVDLENNKIELKHDTKEYEIIMQDWIK